MKDKRRELHDNRSNMSPDDATENLEMIMQEALKEMFNEVDDTDEKEKKRKKVQNKSGSRISSGDMDRAAAANKNRSSQKKTRADKVILTLEDSEELEDAEAEYKNTAKEEPELDADAGEELDLELSEEDGEELDLELSGPDGEAFDDEEDEETMTKEKMERRRKRKKMAGIVCGSILGIIAAVYLGFAIFFMSHFQFYTKINGVDFGLKPIKDVEAYMAEQVQGYSLSLNESNGNVEKINGSDISLVYKPGDELKTLLKEQNAFLWIKSLWEIPEITASVGVEYDEAALSNVMKGLACMKEENQVDPVSAKPEFNGTEFVVKAEEIGSKIVVENFEKKVNEFIKEFHDTLNLMEEECYVKAKYNAESPEVSEACDTMNDYLKANVTYTFGESKEVVDAKVISEWLKTDDDMKVKFDEKAVKKYIKELAEKYNTYQKKRSFTSGSGNTVSVQGGDYGWLIDQKKEYNALLTNIEKREVVTKEPAYARKAASHSATDWGNTYVEVDLSRQYMYLFVNGAIVTSGPIVTGKPSTGAATPQGIYFIKYCARNATLRGPKQPDGSYEWESPVSYWMPFNGGIGLHDAPWQAAFGGNRYLTHGSHGCVNLPFNVAKTVFANVSAGTPVICHY